MLGHRFSRTTTFRNGCCVTRISTKLWKFSSICLNMLGKKNSTRLRKNMYCEIYLGIYGMIFYLFLHFEPKKNGTIKKKSLVTLNGCWWDTCMFSLPFSGRWSKKSLREALIWRGNLYIMETKKIAILKRKPQDFFSSTSESIVLYCSDN